MLYIQNTSGEITFQSDWAGLLLVTEGIYVLDSFQELGNKVIEICEEEQLQTLLIDATKAEIMPQDVISWMRNDWYPSVVKTALTRIAFVVPTFGIAELTLRQASKHIETINQIEIEYFSVMENAKNWLVY